MTTSLMIGHLTSGKKKTHEKEYQVGPNCRSVLVLFYCSFLFSLFSSFSTMYSYATKYTHERDFMYDLKYYNARILTFFYNGFNLQSLNSIAFRLG